jgi:DNA relaxase NicK
MNNRNDDDMSNKLRNNMMNNRNDDDTSNKTFYLGSSGNGIFIS